MSEYWKSTPKYWCKFCKVFVKDTKLERQQHEATGRHQGSIQRSLRNLHNSNEREEREKQRAKDEVARLNGIVSGVPPQAPRSKSSTSKSSNTQSMGSAAAPAKVSLDDRKAQMKQLAEMGVAIPAQFRGDLALAGEWETVSERKIDKSDDNPETALSYGVRKRKLMGEEEEEEEEGYDNSNMTKHKADWGSRYRSYPDTARTAASTDDIEALLKHDPAQQNDSKSDLQDHPKGLDAKSPDRNNEDQKPDLDNSAEEGKPAVAESMSASAADDNNAAPVVFKKRKSKAAKVA